MNLNGWKRSILVASLVVMALLGSRPWPVRSAEPPQGPDSFKYFGSESCNLCHGQDSANPKSFKESSKFIRLDEYVIWQNQDKHSVAYTNLTTERGRRMASLLHVEDVTRPEVGCLGCHSASVAERTNRQNVAETFKVSEGVSCENCHGPYSGWAAAHQDSSFRTRAPADWARVGFTDLRTPQGKAEKCLSCHIGNVAEGKVVTHEMYAAGHPPLPSIDVATFANAIPRHWYLPAERADPKVRKELGYQQGQLDQTRLAMVSAAVALRTSLKLIADEARTPARTGAPGQSWPDYARFDCWTCHHDLKRDGWRQARIDRDGPPGRVPVSEWPRTLVDLGIDRLAMTDPAAGALRADLKAHEQALRDQANLRPFGRKEAIARAAEDYARSTEILIQKLGEAKFDQSVALPLLRKLVERAETSTPDYDEARHVGWAIAVLVDDLAGALPRFEEIAAVLNQLDKGLKLKLPSGRNYEIEAQMDRALAVIGDYDPATFRAQMAELRALLPPG